jgi:hypothetical protein
MEDQQQRRQDDLLVGLEARVGVAGGEVEGFVEKGGKCAGG